MKITLCGSTRFKDHFSALNSLLTKAGHIVYSCAVFAHAGDEQTTEDKLMLDAVHLSKIVNSDAIYVINPDGYVGESTMREILFARMQDKKIMSLEKLDLTKFGSETDIPAYILE